MMDESALYEQVTGHLARWQRRRLQMEALVVLPRGLLAGLVAAVAVATTARLRPVLHNREVALVALVLALLGLLMGLLALLARKPGLLEQAIFFDRRFNLRERVSTAIEIHNGRLTVVDVLGENQLADAALAAARVDARSGLPLRPRWLDLLLVVAAAGLLVAASVLPNDQESILSEQQAVVQAVADETEHLRALEDRIEQELALDAANREALLEPIRGAADELAQAQISRESAVAALSEAEAELRELSERADTGATETALQAASQPLRDDPASASLGEAMMRGDLAEASAAASQLGENLTQLSAEEVERLVASLAESAASMAQAEPTMAAELMNAAQALQAGDVEQARQELADAAATMQQRAMDQALASQAQVAADELKSAREQVAAAGTQAEGTSLTSGGQSSQGGAGQVPGGQETDSSTGVGPSTGSDSYEGQGAGGPGPGGGHAETVFVPDYVDLGSQSGVEMQLPAECLANPESCGALVSESPSEFTAEQSLVPYQRVFGDYRDAALEALEGDYVPLGMKGLVREYFSSLEP
jgi:hypothetical protein